MERFDMTAQLDSTAAPYGIPAAPASGFVAGTLVHTREGPVPIENLRVGDWALSKAEEGGVQSYKRVVKTFAFEEPKEVICVDVWKNPEGWMNGERAGFVVTPNHPFYVRGKGWIAAELLHKTMILELQGGTTCGVVNQSPLFQTAVECVAWMDGFVNSQRGTGKGRTIDLRDGAVRFDYETVGNRFVTDTSDAATFGFKRPVFNIEVEDNHTYSVGEWGVWVHNMDLSNPDRVR